MNVLCKKLLAASIGGVMACTLAGLSPSVLAARAPHPLSSDSRVREIIYDPNQVYELTGVYGYATTVEFAPGEKILNTAVGDTIGWEIKKFRNHLVLKPVEDDARTNLTVTTNSRVYYFRLSGSKNVNNVTFAVRFVYPGQPSDKQTDGDDTATAGDLGFSPPRLVNRNYKVSGDERQFGLQSVGDDGQFTYFLFKADKAKPNVYTVEDDGTEARPNVRREGPYLVVEQMANGFSLRDGDRVLCVTRSTAAATGATTGTRSTFGSGN